MRRRLAIAIAGVAAAAILLLAVPLAIVLDRGYQDEDLLRLQRDAFAATRGIDLGAPTTDPVELPRIVGNLTAYDASGRRVAGGGPPTAPPLVRGVLTTGRPADASGGDALRVAVPLVSRERVTGAVLAERTNAGAVRDTRAAWLALGALAAAILAAALIAAVVLGRRLARPLERLADASRRLGEGDFSVRAPRAEIAEVDAVGAALDVTARHLGELVQRERAFTADASHQLRTPLAALRLDLEARTLENEPSRDLSSAIAQVDRLQSTIETLLALARDAPRRNAVTELDPVLDDLERRWRGPLADRGRPLLVARGAHAGRVLADGGVVRELLDVLLENALIHGDGAVHVTLRTTEPWMLVEVEDEGRGFADPGQAFVRRGDAAAGHGIGLALGVALAEAEGGRLAVTRPGRHPMVTLTLRLAEEDMESKPPMPDASTLAR